MPWVADGMSEGETIAVETVGGIATNDTELANMVAVLPWFADDITEKELEALSAFERIASTEAELAKTLVALPWFADEIADDERWALVNLYDIAAADSELANMVASLPWFTDGITKDEQHAFNELVPIALTDAELAKMLAALPWFADEITDDERWALVDLHYIATTDSEVAKIVANLPWEGDDITEIESYVLGSLASVAAQGTDAFDRLTSQLWFTDGLDKEEQALIVTLGDLASRNTNLYDDLLRTYFTQRKKVSLPLGGDINIRVFQAHPFPPDEDLLTIIEDTARITEDFMQVPFPMHDIILLITASEYGIEGGHYGTHMTLQRNSWDLAVDSVPHETAHYYFYSHFGHPWLHEGMAEFIESYFNDQNGVQDMSDRETELSMDVENFCVSDDLENIRHLTYRFDLTYVSKFGPPQCAYHMGENFLISIFNTIGERAMSAAVRELYLRNQELGMSVDEEEIYNAFLKHTPADKKEALRGLYQTLHGGAFAFDVLPFDDDHADELSSASEIVTGEALEGTLDYMFDFDYFKFQTNKDQKYILTVNHASLRTSSITLYDPDGLTQVRWKSRTREASGPQIQWVAPSSDEYYFAVQNFGGKTGGYTLTITPVASTEDDHGDTIATATSISLGQVVHGTVDDDFDYDYFRFHAVEGKNYRILITGGTLEYFHRHLYTADGVPHDYGYESWYDGTYASWSEAGDWTPSSSGTYYLAIDGADGSVGSYTVTITEVEVGSDD